MACCWKGFAPRLVFMDFRLVLPASSFFDREKRPQRFVGSLWSFFGEAFISFWNGLLLVEV